MIDYIIAEHQLSKLYISQTSPIRKISDYNIIIYLEYIVCDLIILAAAIDFLHLPEIQNDLYQYYLRLKDIYRSRAIHKSNEQTIHAFYNIEKIFNKDMGSKLEIRLRVL